MAWNVTKFSDRGLQYQSGVDVGALTDVARRERDVRRVVITTAAGQKQTAVFTQNATVKHNLGPVGIAGTLKAAFISFEQLPAGGTLSVGLVAYDKSGTAEVILTDTANPEDDTIRTGASLVIAATNVALAADDTVELHCVASDDAVGTPAQGVTVTLVWEPSEASAPTRS